GRADAGEDADLLDDLVEGPIVERVEVGACERGAAVAPVEKIQLRGDGLGGGGMVAGEHDHVDAGATEPVDGRGRGLAHAVGEGDESEQLEPGAARVGGVLGPGGALRDGEDPESVAGRFVDRLLDLAVPGVVEGPVAAPSI